ncbi:hypothetical protein MITS9504_02453 [Synechococcus sp. MIT S9504]|nr:hypothetical protein MITS9504_02453 [Synechococcus sp. MIT S9504]
MQPKKAGEDKQLPSLLTQYRYSNDTPTRHFLPLADLLPLSTAQGVP